MIHSVNQYAPVAAISGDMAWPSTIVRHKTNIVRFWNRIVNMENSRLPKIIYHWDTTCKGNTWSSNLKEILGTIQLQNLIESHLPVSIQHCKEKFKEIQTKEWEDIVAQKPKLRTYFTFKDTFQTDPYTLSFMNRKSRSYLAQYRCGILPLEIETGRWINKPLEERCCKVCKSDAVEDEHHITFCCPYYKKAREALFDAISTDAPEFSALDI